MIHSDAEELVIDKPIKAKGMLLLLCKGTINLNADIEAEECHFFCENIGATNNEVSIQCFNARFSIMTYDAGNDCKLQFDAIQQKLENYFLINHFDTDTDLNLIDTYLKRLAYLMPYLIKLVPALSISTSLSEIVQSCAGGDFNAFVPVLEYLDLSIHQIKLGERFTPLYRLKCTDPQKSNLTQNSSQALARKGIQYGNT